MLVARQHRQQQRLNAPPGSAQATRHGRRLPARALGQSAHFQGGPVASGLSLSSLSSLSERSSTRAAHERVVSKPHAAANAMRNPPSRPRTRLTGSSGSLSDSSTAGDNVRMSPKCAQSALARRAWGVGVGAGGVVVAAGAVVAFAVQHVKLPPFIHAPDRAPSGAGRRGGRALRRHCTGWPPPNVSLGGLGRTKFA